jgi:hypothetical protein
MPAITPISHHLHLYNYWLSKHGSRRVPARSDLVPGEIPWLLPHLKIIDQIDDQFRYRLMGTAIVWDLGHDLTGAVVGSYLGDRDSAARVRAVYQRVFTKAQPVFSMSKYQLSSGAVHSMSMLVLPLSTDGARVNMTVASLIARFEYDLTASRDWLRGTPIKVCSTTKVQCPSELNRMCLEWERVSQPSPEDRHPWIKEHGLSCIQSVRS